MDPKTVVAPEIEQAPASPPSGVPGAEHLEPFVAAARDVLEQELGCAVRTGRLARADSSFTTHEVTAIVDIVGQLTGLAMYGMREATALAIVGRLMGAPVEELDDLTLSGIGELANVITGCATTTIARLGLEVDIAPPILLQGAGSRVSTAGIRRLVVPLVTDFGTIEAQLAAKVKV